MARLSAETARKQAREHPDIVAADYAAAQRIIDEAPASARYDDPQTGRKRMIYVKEDDRAVMVVKATADGGGLYVVTLYRLSRDQAKRDREVARLLRKAQKK